MKKIIGTIAIFSAISTGIFFSSCSKNKDQLNDPAGSTGIGDSTYVIGIQSNRYEKPDLWVGTGIPVIWVNRDSRTHTVTADDNSFSSGPIQPGTSFTKIFSVPGMYSYHDEFSEARGSMTVFGREPH